MTNSIENTVFSIIVLIYSIIIHEVAHGYVAYKLGDKTAFHAGRLSLNPISHLDMFGSVFVPVITTFLGWGSFGWAKPVPVNPYNLRTKYADFWVSAAGIAANLVLFAVSYAATHIILHGNQSLFLSISPEILLNGAFIVMYVNLSLAIFNLIPVPPFDGMNILRSLIPSLKNKYLSFEHNPVFMIIAILIAFQIFKVVFPLLWGLVIHSLGL